jgi:magnesium-transporting ATPase (P-type)
VLFFFCFSAPKYTEKMATANPPPPSQAAAGAPSAAPFAWWACSVDECLHAAESTTAEQGLSAAEAQARLAAHGRNAMTPPERPSFLRKLWAQINNALIWILLAAGIISGAQEKFVELGLILGVVAINVTIGVVQEGKAEKAADALSSMLAPRCAVVRNGVKATLDADQLVLGDIVFVTSGDRVPADLRLLSCTNLKVLESMLTGESMAVNKTTAACSATAGVGDRKCMAFSATLVQQGQGVGLVVGTGDNTAIGAINTLVQNEAEKPSSLQVQLEIFGRVISLITLAIGVAAFLLAFFYTKSGWAEAFRASVAIAVAIIPEGLPSVVTITMALGVSAMASHKAIVRKLPAVETLGSVSTVCSDKTGTLTKNEMTAVAFITAEAHYPVTGVGYDPTLGSVTLPSGAPAPAELAARLRAMLDSAVLPNDGGVSKQAGGAWGISGDPTDVAPLVLYIKAGGNYTEAQK